MRSGGTSPIEPVSGLLFGSAAIPAESPEDPLRDLHRKIDELEQFAYTAAHDLQEPLRMVAGYAQILSDRYAGQLDPPAAEFLGFALDGARRMQDLVDGLLLLACADPGEDQRRLTSSAEAAAQALANLRLAIEESHAVVRLGRLPEVLADPPQLVRLFQNLIGNAIRYRSSHPPQISVEGQERSGDWLFCIADNGRGFVAAPVSGLGMEICRRIVQRHGGRLWIASPGDGAIVHFTLAKS